MRNVRAHVIADSAAALREAKPMLSTIASSANHRLLQAYHTFFSKFTLALSTAAWAVACGLPAYSVFLNFFFFGEREVPESMKNWTTSKYLDKNWLPCRSSAYGRYINIAKPGEMPHVVPYKKELGKFSFKFDTQDDSFWCGLMPQFYETFWPNAAQMLIFTVYMNVGTTIKQAWEGVVGTWIATMNMWTMQFIFPHGAKAFHGPCKDGYVKLRDVKCTGDLLNMTARDRVDRKLCRQKCTELGDRCTGVVRKRGYNIEYELCFFLSGDLQLHESAIHDCHMKVPKCEREGIDVRYQVDAHFSHVACWIDNVLVIFLFLLSGAAENTMKFGLSWHVYYMMRFMDPNVGAKSGKLHVTVPFLEWSIPHVEWDSEYAAVMLTSLLGAMVAIIATLVPFPHLSVRRLPHDVESVIDAMCGIWKDTIDYFSLGQFSAVRFQITHKMGVLDGLIARMDEDLRTSWWEVFGCGKFGHVRAHLFMFGKLVADSEVKLRALRVTVTYGRFNSAQNKKFVALAPRMVELTHAVSELMKLCLEECWRSDGIEEDREDLLESIEEVKAHLNRLFSCYALDADKSSPSELIFLCQLSNWIQMVVDFAGRLTTEEESRSWAFVDGVVSIWESFHPKVNIYRRIRDHNNLLWACRNTLSISICFAIPLYFHGELITAYSSAMASTLALLISHSSASVMIQNMQRLLAVTVSELSPDIIFTILDPVPCGHYLRAVPLSLAILGFTWGFLYMYYTSHQFALLGCLVAGLGTPLLMVMCFVDTPELQQKRYQKIGMVVTAVLVQALVDTMLKFGKPENEVCKHLREVSAEIEDGYSCFFAGDGQGVRNAVRSSSEGIATCRSVLPQCDAALRMCGGLHKPFNVSAADEYLQDLRDLSAILEQVYSIAVDPETDDFPRVLELLFMLDPNQSFADDFLELLCTTFSALLTVLEHRKEIPIADESVQEMSRNPNGGDVSSILELAARVQEFRWPTPSRTNGHVGDPCGQVHGFDDAEAFMLFAGDRHVQLTMVVHGLCLAIETLKHVRVSCIRADIYS